MVLPGQYMYCPHQIRGVAALAALAAPACCSPWGSGLGFQGLQWVVSWPTGSHDRDEVQAILWYWWYCHGLIGSSRPAPLHTWPAGPCCHPLAPPASTWRQEAPLATPGVLDPLHPDFEPAKARKTRPWPAGLLACWEYEFGPRGTPTPLPQPGLALPCCHACGLGWGAGLQGWAHCPGPCPWWASTWAQEWPAGLLTWDMLANPP